MDKSSTMIMEVDAEEQGKFLLWKEDVPKIYSLRQEQAGGSFFSKR